MEFRDGQVSYRASLWRNGSGWSGWLLWASRRCAKLTHARILLLADETRGEACSDAEIVLALGTSLRTIERLRKRFVTEGLEAALDHKPQPARPDKIKGDVEQKLIELTCSDPPQGRCHWTLQLLADELVVLGLVDTISTVTVWQPKKKTRVAKLTGDTVPPTSRDRRPGHGGSAAASAAAARASNSARSSCQPST